MLYTADFSSTKSFYCDTLGFRVGGEMEEWMSLEKDDISIMFSAPNAHIPFNGAQLTGSLYVLTDEVDALWNKVKDKAKVCYEIENFDHGMREFAIFDNNGYLLQFG
jgi:catechol 2,3-dioxygenase-like lactoylglutathione lyase family enzyme